VNVAMCDLDGNGTQEIVTGAMEGGGPHVRIFSADGDVLYRGGFFAYASDFRGGVNVACGDVDGDGRADIVTGAGLGGGPHVKVFDPYGNMKYETFAGGASENTGASVAVGDIDGNGDMEIIAGRMGAGAPTVMVFNKTVRGLSHLIGFNAFENYEGGIQVSAADIDGDGKDELGVATSKHETGLLRYFDINGSQTALLKPFDTATEKGLVAARVNVNGSDRVLAVSQSARDTNEVGKYIRVDISEQRLYAYENGALANSFLVSTGLYSYPTPLGKTSVMDKLLWHDYVWSYGLNNPDNYNLPNVKFNLRIYPHIYIHYAYWHHNFGHRMSHGCINVGLEDSEWIFNWANVGTSVEIVP